MGGAAVALLVRMFFLNTLTSIQFLVIMVGILFSQQESLGILAVRLGYSDLVRTIRKTGPQIPAPAFPAMGFVGATVGFLLVLFFADIFLVFVAVTIIAIVGLFYFMFQKRRSVPAKAGLTLLVGFILLALLSMPVTADPSIPIGVPGHSGPLDESAHQNLGRQDCIDNGMHWDSSDQACYTGYTVQECELTKGVVDSSGVTCTNMASPDIVSCLDNGGTMENNGNCYKGAPFTYARFCRGVKVGWLTPSGYGCINYIVTGMYSPKTPQNITVEISLPAAISSSMIPAIVAMIGALIGLALAGLPPINLGDLETQPPEQQPQSPPDDTPEPYIDHEGVTHHFKTEEERNAFMNGYVDQKFAQNAANDAQDAEKFRKMTDTWDAKLAKQQQDLHQESQNEFNTWYRDYLNLDQDVNKFQMNMYQTQSKIMDAGESGVEWTKWGCDKGVDILSGVTGEEGKFIKRIYTLGENMGEGLGDYMADGENLKQHLETSATKALVDLGFDATMEVGFKKIKGTKIGDGLEWIQEKTHLKENEIELNPHTEGVSGNDVNTMILNKFKSDVKNFIPNTGVDKFKESSIEPIFKVGEKMVEKT
jgi:hypothetical protein